MRAAVVGAFVVSFVACGGAIQPLTDDGDGGTGDDTDGGVFVDAGRRADAAPPGADAGRSPRPTPGDPETPTEPVPPIGPGTDLPITVPPVTGVPNDAVGSACLRVPTGSKVASNVHVVGVYEASNGNHGWDTPRSAGDIDVTVKASASPATLILNSYEPVRWHVQLETGASVARVIVGSYYLNESSVDGVAPSLVEAFGSPGASGCAYGHEPQDSDGGCEFVRTIGAVRAKVGALETTFQGSYGGSKFVVPPPAGTLHASYDNTKPCSKTCAGSAVAMEWREAFPGMSSEIDGTLSIDGTTAKITTSIWGVTLEGSRGARCGKHYFEVDASGASARVSARYGSLSHYPLFMSAHPTATVQNGRVGVALDLDLGTISFIGGSGSGGALPLWSFYEVVPAVEIEREAAATLKLVTRPPFVHAVPAGFAADL